MTCAFKSLLLVAMVTAMPLTGCKKLFQNKAADCATLRDTYNSHVEKVRAAVAKAVASNVPADLDAVSKAMDDAGHSIGALNLGDDKLKGMVKKSAGDWERAAKDVRGIKNADVKGNQKGLSHSNAALQKHEADTNALVAEMNAYCTG